MEKNTNQTEALRPSRSRVVLATLAATTALFATACAGEESSDGDYQEAGGKTKSEITISKEIFADGIRVIDFENSNFGDIYQFCDGPDLVEQVEYVDGYNAGAGNSMTRSVDHLACSDGTLTATDFQLPEVEGEN